MKIKILIASFLLIIPFTGDAKAQCATSTCITGAIIDLGLTRNVSWDRVDTHYQYLDPAADCTTGLVNTGITNYRWHAPTKVAVWASGADGFCVIPGCDFQSDIQGTTISNQRCEE